MKKLANFSVETDTVVLLEYQDGQAERVAVWRLAKHLVGADLVRVRAAIKLRQDFIRSHISRLSVILFLTGAALVAVVGGRDAIVRFVQPTSSHAVVSPPNTVVPVAPTTTPAAVPSPQADAAPSPVQPAAPAVTAANEGAALSQAMLQPAQPVTQPATAANAIPLPQPTSQLQVLGLSVELGGLLEH
jgi:hypothetical protein